MPAWAEADTKLFLIYALDLFHARRPNDVLLLIYVHKKQYFANKFALIHFRYGKF
jgi:hypothetical protein